MSATSSAYLGCASCQNVLAFVGDCAVENVTGKIISNFALHFPSLMMMLVRFNGDNYNL